VASQDGLGGWEGGEEEIDNLEREMGKEELI
jgi:hypothetical protein